MFDAGEFVKEGWTEEGLVNESAYIGGGDDDGPSFVLEGCPKFVPEGRKTKRAQSGGQTPRSARSDQDRAIENAKWEERKAKRRAELEAQRRAAILAREKVRGLQSHC